MTVARQNAADRLAGVFSRTLLSMALIFDRIDWSVSSNTGREIWRRVFDFANADVAESAIVERHGPATNHSDYKKQTRQIRVSLLQAREFFAAAEQATLFTSPNHLYYGMVSLCSAFMLLNGTGEQSLDYLRKNHANANHGLKFTVSLSEAAAKKSCEILANEPTLRALVQENEELTAADVDDVIGELWLRILDDDRRRLRRFAATRPASLDAWLAMQASQVAHTFVAKRGPKTISIDDVPPIADRPRIPRPAPQMMKVEEVAARWDLNSKTVYAMIERGELAARRCGRVIRVPRHVVESFEQASVAPGRTKSCR